MTMTMCKSPGLVNQIVNCPTDFSTICSRCVNLTGEPIPGSPGMKNNYFQERQNSGLNQGVTGMSDISDMAQGAVPQRPQQEPEQENFGANNGQDQTLKEPDPELNAVTAAMGDMSITSGGAIINADGTKSQKGNNSDASVVSVPAGYLDQQNSAVNPNVIPTFGLAANAKLDASVITVQSDASMGVHSKDGRIDDSMKLNSNETRPEAMAQAYAWREMIMSCMNQNALQRPTAASLLQNSKKYFLGNYSAVTRGPFSDTEPAENFTSTARLRAAG